MPPAPMTPQRFIAKWKKVDLSERSAAQQHFLDLCELLDQPKPAEVDPSGAIYTFERGVQKTGGQQGWADVWKRDFFAWECKRKDKHKDLTGAYQQLLRYREDLGNPPLLIVSDIGRSEIHTNFTNTAKQIHRIELEEIAQPEKLALLRKVFTDPEALRPGQTTEAVTQEVADRFARLADGMRRREIPVRDAARFLMKLMFCMFAEDIDLLEDEVFTKVLKAYRDKPARLSGRLKDLFEKMLLC